MQSKQIRWVPNPAKINFSQKSVLGNIPNPLLMLKKQLLYELSERIKECFKGLRILLYFRLK